MKFEIGPECESPEFCLLIGQCQRAVLIGQEKQNKEAGMKNSLKKVVAEATCKNQQVAEAKAAADKS